MPPHRKNKATQNAAKLEQAEQVDLTRKPELKVSSLMIVAPPPQTLFPRTPLGESRLILRNRERIVIVIVVVEVRQTTVCGADDLDEIFDGGTGAYRSDQTFPYVVVTDLSGIGNRAGSARESRQCDHSTGLCPREGNGTRGGGGGTNNDSAVSGNAKGRTVGGASGKVSQCEKLKLSHGRSSSDHNKNQTTQNVTHTQSSQYKPLPQ